MFEMSIILIIIAIYIIFKLVRGIFKLTLVVMPILILFGIVYDIYEGITLHRILIARIIIICGIVYFIFRKKINNKIQSEEFQSKYNYTKKKWSESKEKLGNQLKELVTEVDDEEQKEKK